MTARVLRATRLSGTVRLPDGRPAHQILIIAKGIGSAIGSAFTMVRTAEDGTYTFDVPPMQSYILAVEDKTWAAQSFTNVVVREGQAQERLDFTLIKGTLLNGQVTEGTDHRPLSGASVWLVEEGGLLPKDLRGVNGNRGRLIRGSQTDAQGRYQFRVGPGRYTFAGTIGRRAGTDSQTFEVTNEAEFVRNLTLKLTTPIVLLKGTVIEKTEAGDRPVAKARRLQVADRNVRHRVVQGRR